MKGVLSIDQENSMFSYVIFGVHFFLSNVAKSQQQQQKMAQIIIYC